MQAYWFLLAISLTAAVGILSVALLRRGKNPESAGADWDWANDFSIARYRPMERLLSGDDDVFLRAQPGYDPAMTKSLHKNRRRVFRSYMKSLRNDFNRLYSCAKQSVLYSPTDESALVQVLFRQRLIFYWAVGLIEVRLALHATGMGTIDVRPLVQAVQGMADAVRVLQPVPAAA